MAHRRAGRLQDREIFDVLATLRQLGPALAWESAQMCGRLIQLQLDLPLTINYHQLPLLVMVDRYWLTVINF